MDEDRKEELKEKFRAGEWGLSCSSDMTVLNQETLEGATVIDDGLSTALALKELFDAFEADNTLDFPANLKHLFATGAHLQCKSLSKRGSALARHTAVEVWHAAHASFQRCTL